MESDMMNVDQLAAYLQRDAREVGKLASRGHLPGHKVGGEWRFARAEINNWIETQLHEYTNKQLARLESVRGLSSDEPYLSSLMSEACTAVPLSASTRA